MSKAKTTGTGLNQCALINCPRAGPVHLRVRGGHHLRHVFDDSHDESLENKNRINIELFDQRLLR